VTTMQSVENMRSDDALDLVFRKARTLQARDWDLHSWHRPANSCQSSPSPPISCLFV
jgi:hypothetical protein